MKRLFATSKRRVRKNPDGRIIIKTHSIIIEKNGERECIIKTSKRAENILKLIYNERC